MQVRRRLGYIEATRGVGALIVANAHFWGLFDLENNPGFGMLVLKDYTPLSPLLILIDGDAAVCMFFILSGYVLTLAFSRYVGAPVAALSGRFLRLFVPGILSCALGYVLFLANTAGSFSGALSMIGGSGIASWQSFLRDAFINVPWLGYGYLSTFYSIPWIAVFLQDQGAGHNSALWSLSIEWQGSLLLFGLVALNRRNRKVWRIALAAAFLLTIRSWFFAFLFGHLWAVRHHAGHGASADRPWARRMLSVVCLVAGGMFLLRAAAGLTWPFSILYNAALPVMSCDSAGTVVRLYASALIFAGISALRELHPWLERPAFRWLGTMSFPIYLTHFPAIYFVATTAYLSIPEAAGSTVATAAAFGTMVVATFVLAHAFLIVDRAAISRGAQLRQFLMQRH